MVIVSNSLYVSREFETPSKGPVVYSHEKPYLTVVLQISEIHKCQISSLKQHIHTMSQCVLYS